jgi:uncharacterized protein YjbI with pentapeptide repeats
MRHFTILAALTAVAILGAGPVLAQNEAARTTTAERVVAGASCPGCDLFQANLSRQDLDGRDFTGARLRQSDLSLVTMDNASLARANLTVANGFGGRFNRTDFTNADFTSATMVGAWFGGAVFAGANLTNTNLSGAYLFTARGVTQQQLDAACGDETTALPNDLTIKLCPGAQASPQLRGRSAQDD